MPPLGIVLAMRCVDSGFLCPGHGCWLGSSGMLLLGSSMSPPSTASGLGQAGCAEGSLMRWPYTLYMAGLR